MASLTQAPLRPIAPRLIRASWLVVAVCTLVSLAGTAAAPLLLVKAPLLLVALAPDGRHVALVAGRVDPLLLLTVSVVRRAAYGIGVYGLGAAYGDAAVSWIEARARRLGKALRHLERLFARFGAAMLVVLPLLSVCVLAGAARTRLRVALPALVLGDCLWAGTAVWLGTRFAGWSHVLLDFFSARLLESTLVCAALVLAHQLLTRRKQRPPAPRE